MDRVASSDYEAWLLQVARGFGFRFPELTARRMVFIRLLVENGQIHDGVPGGRTAQQERQARTA